jgi:hypothetical protein
MQLTCERNRNFLKIQNSAELTELLAKFFREIAGKNIQTHSHGEIA